MKAAILVLLLALPVAAQITRSPSPLTARIWAPNSDGDDVLCPGCAGYVRLEGGAVDPGQPIAVRVDGRTVAADMAWPAALWFTVPADVRPGIRGGWRRVAVEVAQGEKLFVGSCRIALSNPRFTENQRGQIAGLWRYGLNGGLQFTEDQPIRLGSEPTFLLFHASNLGAAYLDGQIAVYIGGRRFLGHTAFMGMYGLYSITVVVEAGGLAAGEHEVYLHAAYRRSPAMPPIRFAD